MKKVVFIQIILSMLSLGLIGCVSVNTQSIELKESQNHIERKAKNVKAYEGNWINTEFKMIEFEGYKAPFGTKMTIHFLNDYKAGINIYDISAPPANRIASVETEVIFSKDGKGKFYFNNDGWGTSGTGIIEIDDKQNIVYISIEHTAKENLSDWGIYSGKKIFKREED